MDIKENLTKFTEKIPSNVQLIAVSKTRTIEEMEEAYEFGIRKFGENKVQEIIRKFDEFHQDVEWHLIGHLQTNKVKYIVDKVHLIQSLDSIKLLKEIDPLMVKVFRVHFSHDPELLMKVHSLFGKLKCELEEHLLKEENILFPLMIKYDQAKDKEEKTEIEEDIRIIVNEHEAAGDILKELAEVTDDYKVPEWGCISFKLLYDYLHDLEKDLFIHIHKENNILFPRY